MPYGARIIKRNWLPGGSIYLKVAFWDDAARKGQSADHVNDFVIRREVPKGNVTEWRRRVVDGVKQLQRADTLEWVDAETFKKELWPDVQPATDTLTPQEWLDREIDTAVAGYVSRWRAKGSRKGSAVSARLDAMPDESARLEQVFRDIPVDLDEKAATEVTRQ